MTRSLWWWVGIVLLGVAAPAPAQLVTSDDSYSIPFGPVLLVEAPGVLENDTFNGEPAEDGGATAALVVDVSHGVLSCETEPGFALCPDGSFTYDPDPDFPGTDSFVYQASVGGELSQAAVTLTACSGGPDVFVCWKEAPYLGKLTELGYGLLQEGFEDDLAWGSARSPFTASFIISQGIRWETNHPDPPASNELTTGSGPARTGMYGVFDPEHGYATGIPAQCDVDVPPPACLFHDGFTGTREPDRTLLHGVGGYFTGAAQPKLAMILDGGPPIKLGATSLGDHVFWGVIDTAGFQSFRVEETDGKIGQARFVFGDDFTLATGAVPPGYVSSTLRVERSSITPGDLILRWSPSCSSGAVEYAIYEGTIGSYYSHARIDCADDGADFAEEITPDPADSYYLVVPLGVTHEGSYGADALGAERPVAPNPAERCLDLQATGGCG